MQNSNNPYNQNQPNPFGYSSDSIPVAQASENERMDFVRKTYVLFLAGILCCIVAGVATLNVAPLFMAARTVIFNPIIAIALILGASWGAQAVSRTEGLNYAALFGFTGLIGWLFTPILAIYEMRQEGILVQAAALSVLTFGSLTAYVFISKKDFSFLGGILFVGLVGLILGGLANLFFFHSPVTSYLMAWFSLLLFSGYVLYDTSNIMQRYDSRGYCSAALSLFLDFFNIFMAILRILGGSRR